jgi:predicted ester cyclase
MTSVSTTTQGDRSVVENLYGKVLTAGGSRDPGADAERILSADWKSVGDYSGQEKDRSTFTKQVEGFMQLMPDLTWAIEEIISAGDRFVVRSRASGTPRGAFMGVDGAGRRFEIMTVDIHTVRGGQITRTYHVEDWVGALAQLRKQ